MGGPLTFTQTVMIKIALRSFYDCVYVWKPNEIKVIMEITSCHSGFHYDVDKCTCYTTDDVSCSAGSAVIRRGYWFGVVNEQKTILNNLSSELL